jgi:hypothetical protein
MATSEAQLMDGTEPASPMEKEKKESVAMLAQAILAQACGLESWLSPLCSGSTLLRRAFRGGHESGGTLNLGTGLDFGSVLVLAST